MDILSRITPAETLLLKYCSTAELKDLIKYTFMDLLLKNVIEINNVEKKAHASDKYVRSYTYIIGGKNLKKYKYKSHEFIFLSPFLKSESIQILFSNYVRMAYESAKGSWSYKKLIRSSDDINLLFNETFFSNLLRNLLLTEKGSKVRNDILDYLNKVEGEVSNFTNDDTEKGLELLMLMGGNIFLLKNLDFELIKNIDKVFLKKRQPVHNDFDDTCSYFWIDTGLGSMFNLFDSVYEGVNDVLDAFDSEYDTSSCSSFDSDGCSSCGGCGGCD